LLGTSGTVTTIAGVFLGLPRYDRRRVDGLWMSSCQVDHAVASLRKMTYAERAANGCIGETRADLVLAGCAILEAIRQVFPAERIRIADRGLRDGMLIQLISADRSLG
jgi:exopolyphosphatase/guanosine-5'-triphosphate,3'-diphosphate pyrophosphatase